MSKCNALHRIYLGFQGWIFQLLNAMRHNITCFFARLYYNRGSLNGRP